MTPTTRALLAEELDDRYGRHYEVVDRGVERGGAHLPLRRRGVDVALVLADRADDGARLLAADPIAASPRQARRC